MESNTVNENKNNNDNVLYELKDDEYNINIDISNFLQDFEKISQKKENDNYVMDRSQMYAEISNYDMNFNVKQLGLICEYYGNKNIKVSKLKKQELIENIIMFENNPQNLIKVLKRKQQWHYLEELKNDGFFKKYILV
jgi:hypothetical protein